MSEQEKIEVIADILEMEEDEIERDVKLEDCEAWDSVAILSVIAVINDKFNRFPHAEEIKVFKTIGDLMDSLQ